MGSARGYDVVVLGGGPAALTVAAATARKGLGVLLAARSWATPWSKTFGSFALANQGAPWTELASQQNPIFLLGSGPAQHLGATYLRFDTARLQAALVEEARAQGVDFLPENFVACRAGVHNYQVEFERTTLSAQFLLDATGVSALQAEEAIGYQTAYGIWIESPPPALSSGEMRMMDFSLIESGIPTFAYVLRESNGLTFVQETQLCSKKPVPWPVLKNNLRARLRHLGWKESPHHGEEFCLIPLGIRRPSLRNQVIPFGAKAGFVQPATGYQLHHAIRKSEAVAGELASARADRESRVEELRERTLRSIWTTQERATFSLYEVGAEILMEMDSRQLAGFLSMFFESNSRLTLGFLEGNQSLSEASQTLFQVFSHAPLRMRRKLLSRGGSLGTQSLLAALFRGEM